MRYIMLGFTLGVAVGLVVGWNFLPQPEFVKNFIENLKK